MQLSDEQKKVIGEKVAPNLKKCPVCEKNDWGINDIFLSLSEYPEGPVSVGKAPLVFPVIAATCIECGYTRLFSAIQLGLLSKDEPKDNVEKEEK